MIEEFSLTCDVCGKKEIEHGQVTAEDTICEECIEKGNIRNPLQTVKSLNDALNALGRNRPYRE